MIEMLYSNFWVFWAILALICLLTELSTGNFYIVCFTFGAAVAAISSPFCVGYVQMIVFIIVSSLSIFLIRPLVVRWMLQEEDYIPSNADAIIGRVAIVSQDIPANGFGRVALDGDDWKATAKENIEKGSRVTIVSRNSVILNVERINTINS